MADSFNKKEREKKRRKRKKDKAERREQRKESGSDQIEFMYMDEDGNLTATKPDPTKKKKEISADDIELGVPKREKSDESAFLRAGIVKFFNAEKGYGFITDKDTKDSFFVHSNNLIDEIRDNDKVTFEVGKGPKGPIATDVKLA
ncbi:MAG: cold shock CspA family protein [Maribacter sp.]|jgi:cold shock CspA family protein